MRGKEKKDFEAWLEKHYAFAGNNKQGEETYSKVVELTYKRSTLEEIYKL